MTNFSPNLITFRNVRHIQWIEFYSDSVFQSGSVYTKLRWCLLTLTSKNTISINWLSMAYLTLWWPLANLLYIFTDLFHFVHDYNVIYSSEINSRQPTHLISRWRYLHLGGIMNKIIIINRIPMNYLKKSIYRFQNCLWSSLLSFERRENLIFSAIFSSKCLSTRLAMQTLNQIQIKTRIILNFAVLISHVQIEIYFRLPVNDLPHCVGSSITIFCEAKSSEWSIFGVRHSNF